MINYIVTVTIAPEVHDEWLQWMKNTHVPDGMNTGLIAGCTIARMLDVDDCTYSFTYLLKSKSDYEVYQRDFAQVLQRDHSERYAGMFSAKRTLFEVVT